MARKRVSAPAAAPSRSTPVPTVEDFLRLRDRSLAELEGAGVLGVREIAERRRKGYFELLERVPMRRRRGVQLHVMWSCFGIWPEVLPPELRGLQRAVAERRLLEGDYFSAYSRERRRRVLEPYRLLCAPLADYLFAREPGGRELKTYRVDRFLKLDCTARPFRRQLQVEWEDYIRPDLFARQELAFNLRMRFRGRAAEEVKRNKARFRGARLQPDGSVTHVFRAAHDAYYIHLALHLWNWDAEVIGPEASALRFQQAVRELEAPPPRSFLRWMSGPPLP